MEQGLPVESPTFRQALRENARSFLAYMVLPVALIPGANIVIDPAIAINDHVLVHEMQGGKYDSEAVQVVEDDERQRSNDFLEASFPSGHPGDIEQLVMDAAVYGVLTVTATALQRRRSKKQGQRYDQED